jgi:site-specific DNA recombinase
LINKIEQHNFADEKFSITLIYLMELASRAYELFKSSEVEQKRQLINFTLSNLTLTGKKLSYDYKKPFDILCSLPNCSVWLSKLDILRTDYYEEVVSYYEFIDTIKKVFKFVA